MKRVGGLWEMLVSFENLHEAARRAAVGKGKRPDVAAFLLDTETELVSLRRELQSGDYQLGADPIGSSPSRGKATAGFRPRRFGDRVVHHALTQVLEPVFEPRFSPFSYACRTAWERIRHSSAPMGSGAFPLCVAVRYPQVLCFH